MTGVLGTHGQREAACHEQPVAAMLGRWRLGGPGQNASGLDVSVALLLGERDEASELDRLATKLEAQ
jgi:hypothetical protein